jgi:N-glycosylase/DNA lyase
MTLEMRIDPLDLDLTLGCGQTFRWRRGEDCSWSGPLGDRLVTMRKDGRRLLVEALPDAEGVEEALLEYLRAADDIASIQKRLGRDPVLRRGMLPLRGLRIVKMDEWECLASYILATFSNIPRIARMIEGVARTYGENIVDDVYSFPRAQALSRASVADLGRLGLGYRAAYINETCRALRGKSLQRLKGLSYEALRNELMGLPGVGEKVADCVCLFGFGRLEAFPIDVWVARSLKRLYGVEGSYAKLRRFASERFGECAGYAQEYLYYNERVLAAKDACAFDGAR